MEIGIAQGKIGSLQGIAKSIHSTVLTNEIEAEGADKLFERIDTKLGSVSKNVYKVHKLDTGSYTYRKAKLDPAVKNDSIDGDFVKTKLTEFKSRLETFQEEWKDEKYKVVDHNTNKIAHLNNTNRGNITKVIGDVEALIELF